jgi:hypothetical protein
MYKIITSIMLNRIILNRSYLNTNSFNNKFVIHNNNLINPKYKNKTLVKQINKIK